MARSGLLSAIGRKLLQYRFKLEGLLFLPESKFRVAERFLVRYHQYLFRRDWQGGRNQLPDWFNHRVDLFTWSEHRNGHWVERGVYSSQVMWPGCSVLDLSCGDGFYPYYFYTLIADNVDAVDLDLEGIAHGKRYHSHPQIRFFCLNMITDPFPRDRYDVITWDGALGHFSEGEIEIVMKKIASSLGETGVLSGYEELQYDHEKSWDHKIAIASTDDMKQLLGQFFRHVRILESLSPGRRNAYFRCSQDPARLKAFE